MTFLRFRLYQLLILSLYDTSEIAFFKEQSQKSLHLLVFYNCWKCILSRGLEENDISHLGQLTDKLEMKHMPGGKYQAYAENVVGDSL